LLAVATVTCNISVCQQPSEFLHFCDISIILGSFYCSLVILDEKGTKDSWKEYMEKLMNE